MLQREGGYGYFFQHFGLLLLHCILVPALALELQPQVICRVRARAASQEAV